MEINEILTKINTTLRRRSDKIFYRYWGSIFSAEDVHARLDKTYLYVLEWNKDKNVGTLSQIHGVIDNTEDDEPQVIFGRYPIFKITSGKREGRKVLQDCLKQGEAHVSVGYVKELIPENFKDPDVVTSELFNEFITAGNISSEEFVAPDTFLCCKKENEVLYTRKNERTDKYLEELVKYYKESSSTSVTSFLQKRVGEDLGGGRVSYPFQYIYGKGVVTLDRNVNGKWYCVDDRGAFYYGDDINIELTK